MVITARAGRSCVTKREAIVFEAGVGGWNDAGSVRGAREWGPGDWGLENPCDYAFLQLVQLPVW